MRLVLDTNIFLSGLIWSRPSSRIIAAWTNGIVELVTCDEMLAEFRRHLFLARFAKYLNQRGLSAPALMFKYVSAVEIVIPVVISPTIIADPDDDVVLGAAVAGRVDAIVSGDYDVLQVVNFRGIEIMTAAQLVVRLNLP